MINDPIELHFEFGDRPAQISPKQLYRVTSEIEYLIEIALNSIRPIDVQLLLVADPQHGSLKFKFKLEVSYESESRKRQRSKNGSRNRLQFSDIASIAAILIALFAPNGIYDAAPLAREILTPNHAPLPTRDDSHSPEDEIHKSIHEIKSQCSITDATRVSIQIPDHFPIILFDRDKYNQRPRTIVRATRQDITGRWNITIPSPLNQQTMILDILHDMGEFSGRIQSRLGDQQITGSRSGNVITWTIDVHDPIETTLYFIARISGDDLDGEVVMGKFGSAKLFGKRI